MNHTFQAVNPDYLAFAHSLADLAAPIATRYFRAQLAVDSKADSSPVTIADREIEQTLRDSIAAHFPNHGIFGEEFGRVNPSSAWQWVIDPIDGTHAFILGTPTFTTLIALCHDNIPVMSAVSQPITQERWIGMQGSSTTLGSKSVRSSACQQPKDAVLGTTAMKYFSAQQALLFEALQQHCKKTVFGGDAYLYAKLASGDYDLVVEAGLKPYDFCALRPVIEGAGGIITDWNGHSITLESDGRVIAAATKELHASALDIIQKAI